MSYVGAGGEEWFDLDVDLFERDRRRRLEALLLDDAERVAGAIGAVYDVEMADDGFVFVVIDGRRRYRAEVTHDERLLLTGILDPDGPL